MKERSQSQDPGWPGRGPEAGRVHTYMYCEREQANVFYHFTRSYLASYIVSITSYVVGPTYLLRSSLPITFKVFAPFVITSTVVILHLPLHRQVDQSKPTGTSFSSSSSAQRFQSTVRSVRTHIDPNGSRRTLYVLASASMVSSNCKTDSIGGATADTLKV